MCTYENMANTGNERVARVRETRIYINSPARRGESEELEEQPRKNPFSPLFAGFANAFVHKMCVCAGGIVCVHLPNRYYKCYYDGNHAQRALKYIHI